MRDALVRILMVTLLFAQSAWAFEGHTGHFEAASATAFAEPVDDAIAQDGHADDHCAHSTVHFVAVHRHVAGVSQRPGGDPLPVHRASLTAGHEQPLTPPPRG